MTNIELEFTNAPGTDSSQTPVDVYVARLMMDAKSGFKACQWTSVPTGNQYTGFEIYDQENGLLSQLDRKLAPKGFERYTLTTSKLIDGSTVYSAAELVSADEKSPLAELYALCIESESAEATALPEESTPGIVSADLTNGFIDSMIQDVEGNRHCLHFDRCKDGFIVDSFGISESVITVTQDWSDSESAQHTMKMVKQDGTLIMSCVETSKNNDEDAELRRLYKLLDETVPIVSTDEALNDIKRYVEGKAYDDFFDRIIKHAAPPTTAPNYKPNEKSVLIYDIFTAVSEPSVIRMFLDEVRLRKGPISEPEYRRLKALAQGTFDIIRNVKRAPNGALFTGRNIRIAYEESGRGSKKVRLAASISLIVNAHTMWLADIYGDDPVTSEGNRMTRCAALILAAILADQL